MMMMMMMMMTMTMTMTMMMMMKMRMMKVMGIMMMTTMIKPLHHPMIGDHCRYQIL